MLVPRPIIVGILEGLSLKGTLALHGLKMPDLRPYDKGEGSGANHVQTIGTDFERGRHGSRPQWLHQMRSDLGRLGAIAEILQIGPFLSRERLRLF
jgi:hypothetical protein